LGPTLPGGAAAAASILPLAQRYGSRHDTAVRRAGHRGNRATLGSHLFEAILERRSGVVTLPHGYGGHYDGHGPLGPAVNRLTSSGHCDVYEDAVSQVRARQNPAP
jgi:hypothetical protein